MKIHIIIFFIFHFFYSIFLENVLANQLHVQILVQQLSENSQNQQSETNDINQNISKNQKDFKQYINPGKLVKQIVSSSNTLNQKSIQQKKDQNKKLESTQLVDILNHNNDTLQQQIDQNQNNNQEQENGNNQHNSQSQNDDNPNQQQQHQQHHYLHPSQIDFWINALIALGLTCVGGFCSGNAIGLMSIQSMQLEVMSMGGNQQQKKMANRILDIVTNHHLFLVTLLLANAMALQTLPLVVHSLMPDWAAILFSTFIVLIIGQIVPQAFCTGPKKIQIAYYCAPIIKVMIKVLWFLAYPISKGLDYLLGEHGHQRIKHKDFANFLRGQQTLKKSEVVLLTSILELRCQRVTDIMVPIKKLYILSFSQKLTSQKVDQIYRKDFSYILVYKDRIENIVGIIKVKQFALDHLKKGNKPMFVKQICKQDEKFLSVYADTNLLQMLMLFQSKSYRLAIVSNKYKKIVPGIESVMYSKSDMIIKNKQTDILGIVFLYDIFKEITEFNEQLQQARPITIHEPRSVEMQDLNRPLMRQNN